MARRRRSSTLAEITRLIFFLGILGISAFLTFWQGLAPQDRSLLFALALVFLVSGSGALILLIIYRKRQRALAWKRAMNAWNQSRQEKISAPYQSARAFTPAQLEKFTAQLFKQMGYRVAHTGQTGDHGVDVRLLNPAGQVELVQCKQWSKPVGEPEVRDLAGAMLHEKAVRGFIIAPGGFSDSARRWARGKPIVLADEREIGRLVQSADRRR